VEDRIRIAKESKADLQEDAGLYSWGNQQVALTETVQGLSRDLAKRKLERGIFEEQLKQERLFLSAPDGFTLTTSLRGDNLVNKLLFTINDLRGELAELASRYTDDHRLVKAKRDELAQAQSRLKQVIRGVLDEHELRLNEMVAAERILQASIDEFSTQLRLIPVSAGKLEFYDAYIDAQWRLYGELITKFSDTETSEAQTLLENQIVQLGAPNIGGVEGETPKVVYLVVAPLFALMMAVAIAFMKEATSHTFQKRAELEDFTGLPVLAGFRKI